MKISIIHPSRQRPEMAEKTIRDWLTKCIYPDRIEYLLSIDITDPDNDKYYSIPHSTAFGIIVIENDNRTAIQAINFAASKSTGDLLIVVSDDFSCPQNWDELLLKELEGKEDFIVKTQDGIQPTLITLPIMDRRYYNQFGYIYHPSYRHMFSDQEMTAVGHMLGKVITSYLFFEHRHYSTGKSIKDAINEKNDRTWDVGKRNFNNRLKTNFGIQYPAIPYSEIKWR